MKRLAMVLAAAVLGTGCMFVHDDDCDPTLTLAWDFQDADGAVVGCSSAGADVLWVDVFVDDVYAATFDCAARRGTLAVGRGTHLVTVEGADDVGVVYREERTVSASRCDGQVVATRPAEGRVNLDYSVSSAPACAGGPCYLWFSVFDDIAGTVAATVNATTVPASFPYPEDVVFRLPVGSYTVEWMDVVTGGLAERRSCTTPRFTVQAGSAPGERQLVPAAPVLLQTTCS